MRNCKDKRAHRYQMAQYALKHGSKPAARAYNTSPGVVRKWIIRLYEEGYASLADRSRRPHTSPRETSLEIKQQAIKLNQSIFLFYPQIGMVHNLFIR